VKAKSLLLRAPERLAWVPEELPDPGPGQVLVETVAGGVSIGTELPHYLGNSRGLAPDYPAMTGYECVARVLKCGAEAAELSPGDRIVSFYGHRTHALVRAERAIPVPPEVSDELAVLSILSCDVAKGVRKLTPKSSDPVLVTGAGTIGLLTLWTLRQYGVDEVDVVEPLPDRQALAHRFGATHIYAGNEIDDIERGYAYGFECSSRDAAFSLLQRSMRKDGMICILADGNLEPLTLTPDFHRKELEVVGSSDGWDYHQHARWFFERTRDQADLLTLLFQWRVSADELIDTFRRLAEGPERPVKVFVRY
jgi:alcohol dehydrogenase